MAENKGKTKGAIMSAVSSAQMAVGSALKGGQMAMGGGDGGASQSIPLLEDLRSIGRENEKNTESMLSIFKAMFVFDKEQAARLRDQSRENSQEVPAGPTGGMKGDVGQLKESKGIPGVLAAAAALTALAAFARGTNLEDIIRLPGQLKGIKGIATFVKGVTKIGTLGLGAKFLDTATDSLKLFKSNFILRLDELKASALTKFKDLKLPGFVGLADKFKELNFVQKISNSKAYALAVSSLNGIKTGIANVVTPMKNAFGAIFGSGGGGPAGSGGAKGALSKLFTPLKAIGKVISKLFLPITIIMGIFDGYQGFMDEFEKEGSILDGIRGAVTGIVDGFVGGLVRLVTDVIGWMLEKLGLKHMAKVITDFGTDVTASFSTAVGGLVDFVTGIFSLDLERITKGLKNLVGGTANFLFTLVTTPIDAAIAFVADIFNLGDPENPFTIKGFLFGDSATGEKGIVTKAIDFFKDLFNMDGIKEKYANIKASVMDFGKRAKAIVAASAAFIKAGFPGGESPTEAYSRVFNEIMNSGGTGDSNGGDVKGEDIAQSTVTNVQGDTTETTYKTETINRYGKKGENQSVTYIDNSSKQNNNTNNNKNETYTGSLTTGSDSYFDREAYGGA
ncbi:hypothetical protein N8956_01060 [bacterium]|nr:hypothetical protein [bacterium]